MTRPVLIGIGSRVIAALVEQLGAAPGLAEAVELHLSPDMPGGRPRASTDLLGRAVVVLTEHGAMDMAERAALPANCAVILVPRLDFASLWPGAANLDEIHATTAREMFRCEADCDIRVAAFILSRFRIERLFHGAAHPAGPLLEQIVAQVLGHPALQALAAAPFDALLHAVTPGLARVFADCQTPVEPAVAAHFGLAWWSPDLQYQQGDVPREAAEHPDRTMVLHPAAPITRAAPFFATTIDPAIAPHGATLLSAESGHYMAPAIMVTALDDALVLGHSGAVAHNHALPANDAVWHTADRPTGPVPARIAAPAFLGFEAGWADDPSGIVGILPRLLAFARLRRRDPSLRLLLPDVLAQARWLLEMLAILSIGDDAIVWLADSSTACETLVLTSRCMSDRVSPFTTAAARDLAAIVPLSPPGSRMLYLRSATMAGRIANEAEMAATLVARGFALVDTDQTRLSERIALLRHASAIVAAQGPALAESVFCPPGASVLELVGPANPQLLFWSLASCAGLRYGYLVGEAVGAPDWNGDYTVPLPMLDYATGLVGTPRSQ